MLYAPNLVNGLRVLAVLAQFRNFERGLNHGWNVWPERPISRWMVTRLALRTATINPLSSTRTGVAGMDEPHGFKEEPACRRSISRSVTGRTWT